MTTSPEAPAIASEFAVYLPSLRRRWLAEMDARKNRHQAAWVAARAAAALLSVQFGAREVYAFGSLVHPALFDLQSDIDLAVSGIPAAQFFKAWAAAGAHCPFDLDLVDLADCSPTLRELISREGEAL